MPEPPTISLEEMIALAHKVQLWNEDVTYKGITRVGFSGKLGNLKISVFYDSGFFSTNYLLQLEKDGLIIATQSKRDRTENEIYQCYERTDKLYQAERLRQIAEENISEVLEVERQQLEVKQKVNEAILEARKLLQG